MKRRVRLFCLILLLMLGVLYLSAESLVTKGVSYFLSGLGFDEVTFRPGLPGLRGLNVEDLAFRYHESGVRISGKVETTVLSYDFLKLTEGTLARLAFSDAEISLMEESGVTSPSADSPTSFSPKDLIAKLPFDHLELKNVRVKTTTSEYDIHNLEMQRGAEISLKGALGFGLYEVTMSALLFPDSGAVSSKGNVARGGVELVSWELDGKFETENSLSFSAPSSVVVLSRQIERATLPLLKISPERAWQFSWGAEGISAEGGMKADDAILSFGDYTIPITKPSAAFSFDYSGGQLTFKKPQLISAASIGLPVPVLDLKIEVQPLPSQDFLLKEGRAGLLGGAVTFGPTRFSMERNSFTVPIKLSGLELSDILNLYPQKNITGSGKFDADFKLDYEPDGPRVKDGNLAAREPGGVIRYDAAELGEISQQGLAIAMDVLREFHYSALFGELDFEPTGDLKLKLSLKGQNPNWQKGRSVELNLNVEENLYELLRGIRLAQGESDEITDLLQKEPEN